MLESDELPQMLEQTSEHLNDNFGRLFDEMLKQRTDRLSDEPEDTEALVEAVTLYHMVIEGMLALTGQHFIMDFNEREGTLPAFVEGFQTSPATSTATSPSAPSSCARRRARTSATSRRSSARWRSRCRSPTASSTALGPRRRTGDCSATRREETQPSPAQCLMRRLKVIGLVGGLSSAELRLFFRRWLSLFRAASGAALRCFGAESASAATVPAGRRCAPCRRWCRSRSGTPGSVDAVAVRVASTADRRS